MSAKIKTITVLIATFLLFSTLIVGVWAAIYQASVATGGGLIFQSKNLYCNVSAEYTGLTTTPQSDVRVWDSSTAQKSAKQATETWTGDTSTFDSTAETISISITIENLSEECAIIAKLELASTDAINSANYTRSCTYFDEVGDDYSYDLALSTQTTKTIPAGESVSFTVTYTIVNASTQTYAYNLSLTSERANA